MVDMPIPQDIIDRILRETDIAEVIGEKIPLKRAGSNLKGLCPFHGEKTPSFNVNPARQIFHCFGCGKGGNVITFLMENERLNFPETVEKLAARLGIVIPKNPEAARSESLSEIYFKINEYAQWYFQNELVHSDTVRSYLKERGLADKTIAAYGLGYAPREGQGLVRFLSEKKIPLDKAVELGLIRKRENSVGHYNFFRERLMFPILNARGQCIAFGGRDLTGESPAKYINSPESPVYHKGREVFGLNIARPAILKQKRVVIVEGYIDVLACAQLGVDFAVAPLGTSLTEKQVTLLKRQADQIILMFDGDTAGKKALARATRICFAAGTHPRAVVLPENKDPGDYLKSPAGKSLQEQVQSAIPAMDFIMGAYLAQLKKPGSDRALLLRKLLGWLNSLPDPIEILTYRQKMEERLGLRTGELDKYIAKRPDFASDPTLGSIPLELLLLWLYIKKPEQFQQQKLMAWGDGFSSDGLRDLAQKLDDFYQRDATLDVVKAMNELPPELQGELSRILMLNYRPVEDYDIADCLRRFGRQVERQRIKSLAFQIQQAEVRGELQQSRGLLAEQQKIMSAKN